jgi:hypothetical protein
MFWRVGESKLSFPLLAAKEENRRSDDEDEKRSRIANRSNQTMTHQNQDWRGKGVKRQ